MEFRYYGDTERTIVYTETPLTNYYNLKSKAEGARRIGYQNKVTKFVNPEGAIAYRAEFQTTLNGERYQSSKYGAWRATEAEAIEDLKKTFESAVKRYAKLAKDPANKIEFRG